MNNQFVHNLYARQHVMLSASLLWQRRPSVCLSVRPSVTLLYCVKTTQLRIMKCSLWATARTLVSDDVILVSLGRRFPSNEGIKEGYPPPLRNRYFTTIGSSSVKTVSDRHRLAAYHNKHC